MLFRTQPGQRRFCLYIGAEKGKAQSSSATDFIPADIAVEMRARSAPVDFVATKDKPLTLQRFQTLEENFADVLGTRQVGNIDCPGNPFLNVTVDALGHVQKVENPARYVSLYEGFLRAPVAGDYAFALDTPGVGHLVIDGVSIVSAPMPDAARKPFDLKKSVALTEGLHRIVVHYAESNPGGKTNADIAQFGLRLHWQPPWSNALMCVPPQAFAHFMPANIVRHEATGGVAAPFIQIELLGRALCAAHLGPLGSSEKALIVASSIDGPPAASIQFSESAQLQAASAKVMAAWVPIEKDISIAFAGAAGKNSARTVHVLASKEQHASVDLQGELEIKSAPDFLYVDDADHRRDETAHIHLDLGLSPPPAIILKERLEMNLLPPAARPMGEFRLSWQGTSTGDDMKADAPPSLALKQIEATPIEGGHRRQRASFTAQELEPLARDGSGQLIFTLEVGGVRCETITLRLLNAQGPWSAIVIAGPGALYFDPAKKESVVSAPKSAPEADGTAAFWKYERVMMLVPRQQEAEHRSLAPLKALSGAGVKTALFLGDPLVENIAPAQAKTPFGIAQPLSSNTPKTTWDYCYIPGPHRYLPIFRFLTAMETQTIPETVVISLGQGDAARQTPLYTFERALDALLTRLKSKGAQKIIVVGIVPEVGREANSEPYQQRVLDILRQHHVESVDVFHAWTSESNWSRRFAAPKESGDSAESSVFTPLPNADALTEIAKMIQEKL